MLNKCWFNVTHRLRRWTNNQTTLVQRVLFPVLTPGAMMSTTEVCMFFYTFITSC